MLTRGYLDGDASAFRDGWFRTGDVGSIDAAGLLRIEGRRDDMIITGGENVSPAEVEQVLLAHPGVADAAVYGRPDPVWGQRVCACVVPSGAVPPAEEELERHCRAALAGYKVPRRWRIVAEIPRNAAGKVSRKELSAGD
jgi:fatty-acyl-CoA synthase